MFIFGIHIPHSSPTLKEYLLPYYLTGVSPPSVKFFFFVFMVPFLCVQWNPFCLFIYLYVCILYVETLSCIRYSQEECIKKSNRALEKKSEKHSCYADYYTVPGNMFFSDVKRQISVFKGHC